MTETDVCFMNLIRWLAIIDEVLSGLDQTCIQLSSMFSIFLVQNIRPIKIQSNLSINNKRVSRVVSTLTYPFILLSFFQFA